MDWLAPAKYWSTSALRIASRQSPVATRATDRPVSSHCITDPHGVATAEFGSFFLRGDWLWLAGVGSIEVY